MVYHCEELELSRIKYFETKDQWESVSAHSQKGIDFLDTYLRFVKDRVAIEGEYAKSLRKLVKSYTPKKKDDSEKFTALIAFRNSIQETGDMAGQHELIAENLGTYVIAAVHDLIRELKEERKKNLSEGARLQQQLMASHQQLEKAKKNYEKSFREAEKAQDNFHRADADLNLSRAEVEKQRMTSSIKGQNCEDYKNEYANQLQKTNTLQNDHYNNSMPNVMQSFQDLDMKRIKDFKNLLIKSAEIERSVYPILIKCLDGIVRAAESVDEVADSEAVIEKYKSGFEPPGDVPFDDLSTMRQNGSDGGSGGDSNSLPGHNSSNHSTPGGGGNPAHRSDTVKGTISAARFKKRANLFTGIFGSNKEDFSELPPNQRKKRIQQKIDDITSKLNQETASRDALLKMKEVYEGNPSLGDPLTITGQLTDSCSAIDKLKADLDKYQTMLDHPDPPAPSPTPPSRHQHNSSIGVGGVSSILPQPNGGSHPSPRSSLTSHRTSFSEESISRSASSSSLCTTSTTNTHPPPPPPMPTASSTSLVPPARPPAPNHLHSTTSTTTTTALSGTSTTSPPPPPPPSSNSVVVTSFNASQGSSHSPESGISLSHNSLPGSDVGGVNGGVGHVVPHSNPGGPRLNNIAPLAHDEGDDEGDGGADDSAEFYDIEPLPVIGTCRALYGFDGVSEGSMALAEGEQLSVIEVDAGDGWTRVRRPSPDGTEGFVPTSYITVTLHGNC